jgi:large subunit ribosomal protein L15
VSPAAPKGASSSQGESAKDGSAKEGAARDGASKDGAAEGGAPKGAAKAAAPRAAAAKGASPQGEASARVGLHNLAPAPGSRRPRKRIGRGEGSGTGKTSGRGQKGAGSRTGSKSRANFEGGQMPIHMRMRKLRGPHMKKSMPFEPFRTHTQPVNIAALEDRFEAGAEVTIEAMRERGLATRKGIPVKVLAKGEISKALTVYAHGFSAGARERIEAAGGTCTIIES